MQSKPVIKIFEGILRPSFYVNEFYVIVHKKYFPDITLLIFGHSVSQITCKPGGWGEN